MKSKKISIVIAASTLLAALGSSAFADDKYNGELGSNWRDHISSTKSRTQVVAELEQARANGQRVGASPYYPERTVTPTSRSAAEVRAEVNQAAQNSNSGPGSLYFGA